MNVLYEIQRLYALYGKNNFDVFRDELVGPSASKMRKLYEGIASGRITDDVTARIELYGSLVKVPISTYNSIKMRLLRRLIDSVFFLDPGKMFVNRRSAMRQECISNVAAMRILLLYGAQSSLEYLAQKTLSISTKYSFTFAAKESCLMLSHLCAYSGKTNDFNKYSSLAEKYIAAEAAENRATLLLERVSVRYAANWSLHQENLTEIHSIMIELEGLRQLHNSAALQEVYFMVSKIYFEVSQEYDEVINLCEEVNQYYEAQPLVKNGSVLSGFIISAMSAYIWLSKYEDAYRLAANLENTIPKGRVAWFAAQEPYFILALRTKDYALARKIFLEVITHPMFRRDDPLMVEKWRLMEFYIRFVSEDQLRVSLLPAEQLKTKSKYRHFRAFASTFSVLSKDLQGFNVVAVFAQILFLLRVRDYDSLIQRDESLQTLRRKRLTKLNYRLAIFAHLIHVMVEQNFHESDIQKAATPWLKKLKNVPPKFKGGTAETLEIIPLEDLWEMMMDELRGRRRNNS